MHNNNEYGASAPNLTEIITARESSKLAETWWPEADRSLFARNYRDAATRYAANDDLSPDERAKHGFCLGMIGDDEGAETLLSEANVGTHPEALALLAWVLKVNSSRRGKKFEDTAAIKVSTRIEQLFKSALANKNPPQFVFNALFNVLGTNSKNIAESVAQARLLYPNWAWPHGIFAARQRADGKLDTNALDDMMRTLPNAQHGEVFHEAYVYSLHLQRWDDAERVLDTLEQLIKKDDDTLDRKLSSLAQMRAMYLLQRARTNAPENYEQVLSQLETIEPKGMATLNISDSMVAQKFLLQVGIETGQTELVRVAATTIVEKAWKMNYSFADLNSWGLWFSTQSLVGGFYLGNFEFELTKHWRDIENELEEHNQEKWRLLIAADTISQREPDPDQIQLLRATKVTNQPWWVGTAVLSAHADYTPKNHFSAGAILAELSERPDALYLHEDNPNPTPLEELWLDVPSLDDPVEFFSGALEWIRSNPQATGQTLLTMWGNDLANTNKGKPVLACLATLSLSRADSMIARDMHQLADCSHISGNPLASILAQCPQPETTQVHVNDLSLLEAATLIALLRACPLDHVRWTLTPLQNSGHSFEPTNKFIGTLFTLMRKGVIAIDASTPDEVVKIDDDGRLTAHLTRVVWRISTHTLALQRDIRDLPRHQWPASWRDHASTLVRDLGVEELVTYLDFLLRDRSLPTPNMDEGRVLFRMQLEHLAISQCYYLAHKSMREALDYQARYRPGRAQLESRIINLLRGNGEKCIAQGWDTRYDRIRQIAPSLLWQALNDVLTGWEQKAFDSPIMTLTLGDSDPPKL